MKHLRRSLSLRLALAFALVSVLLLGIIGLYLFRSLQQEVAWRDDQALLGRLERMQLLIKDTTDMQALRDRPELYANMLGNTQHFLWVLDAQGQTLISINPAALPRPQLKVSAQPTFHDNTAAPYRLVTQRISLNGKPLTLIAGHLLTERENMLAAYRNTLIVALSLGGLFTFLLGAFISQRGLRPLRQLAEQAGAINSQHLHKRLHADSAYLELSLLETSLNQTLTRLDDGYQQLARFSADLAHEMRTPLNNLMGQTQQVLSRSRSSEEYEQLLESNLEEFERLARLIDSLLFLARSEQPEHLLARQPTQLADLAEQLCDYFEGMAQERDLRLINHCSGSLMAEPEMLTRALANLIANAIRHADAGSEIAITSVNLDDQCILSVRNSGASIPEPHLSRLFERFYRADPSRSQPGHSGGLGLAIVQAIMRLHGGSAVVVNEDQGVRFELRFPTTNT